MEEIKKTFQDRLQEINTYIDLLEGIEREAQSGPPRIGSAGVLITAQHQRILYSGVFLHLYNLVEATVALCLDSVTVHSFSSSNWAPGDLTEELRREWVRVMARTNVDMKYENRLVSALNLCDHLIDSLPVSSFKVERGGGGNWDDTSIEAIVVRLGLNLNVSAAVKSAVKRPFRDDLGALRFVRKLRNSLAHGNISFSECGENLTAGELRDLANKVAMYLQEVVDAFQIFMTSYHYLVPGRRPAAQP